MKDEFISIMIVDDEPEARDLLSLLLERVEGVTLAGVAENVDQALDQVVEKQPDLILLDIQMPGKNGFDLVHSLRGMNMDIGYIFITAYDEYAIQAIKVSAFDYLLKPVDPMELNKAIERFRDEKNQKLLNSRIDKLLTNLGINKRLKLNTRTGFLVIDPRDIICCTADGNYTEIFLANERREIVSSNLGSMERELADEDFFRVSRSALINKRYLTHVNSKAGTCRLQGESVMEVKVARNRLSKLEGIWGR